jgi:trans-aconitate methyltransferase
VNLDFERVKVILDLYCGNGILTLGSLLAFPNAIIHALDYHPVLVEDAKTHARVTFHQGLVTDVLASDALPHADIVLVSFASRHHGFTADNIALLSSHTKQFLLTTGDNAGLEQEFWFRDVFNFHNVVDDMGAVIWTPK